MRRCARSAPCKGVQWTQPTGPRKGPQINERIQGTIGDARYSTPRPGTGGKKLVRLTGADIAPPSWGSGPRHQTGDADTAVGLCMLFKINERRRGKQTLPRAATQGLLRAREDGDAMSKHDPLGS